MRSYGGIDITQNLTPPKSLYAEVICIEDAGDLELESGKAEGKYFPISFYQVKNRTS